MIPNIDLIGQTEDGKDAIGQIIKKETKNSLYAEVTSISQREIDAGGQSGHKRELRFTVWAFEYHGEEILDYNGVRYYIYRTYIRDDGHIELYTERRMGNNG